MIPAQVNSTDGQTFMVTQQADPVVTNYSLDDINQIIANLQNTMTDLTNTYNANLAGLQAQLDSWNAISAQATQLQTTLAPNTAAPIGT